MAAPFSSGTGDPGPVHPGVRFRVLVPAGGFVTGPQIGLTAQRQAVGGNVSLRGTVNLHGLVWG